MTQRKRKPRTSSDRLRELRNDAGWTLAELGRRAGMSEQTVWRHENEGSIPTRALAGYCRALGVSEEWLAYGVGHGPGSNTSEIVEAYLQSTAGKTATKRVAELLRTVAYPTLGIRVLGVRQVHDVRKLIEGNLRLRSKMSSDDKAAHARP